MIEDKLKELIKKIMGIDIDMLTDDEKKYPLLSSKLGGMPYQMLVLFQKVESEFGIVIDSKNIIDGKFNTYKDILDIICSSSINE